MNKTGFGFLRIPQNDDKTINYALLERMVDRYMELGGKYFDTAYTYLDGLSEEAIRKAVVERHPRDSFILCDKLPGYRFRSYEACRACFAEQLERCGVSSFDIYLLHGLDEENYTLAEKYEQFRLLRELKDEGRVREIGFSFHDSPELLEKILIVHPETDVVLLQINYLDWKSEAIRAAECYSAAKRHGKKIMVMEPVKGGTLAKLSDEAERLLRSLRADESPAAWAIRFAAGLENVAVVLSGMNSLEQVEDNLRDMDALSGEEISALEQCADMIRAVTAIACTGCDYCAPVCPKGIPAAKYFSLYNEYKRSENEDWKLQPAYSALAGRYAGAGECIGCRACESACPQHLPIVEYLRSVTEVFEKE